MKYYQIYSIDGTSMGAIPKLVPYLFTSRTLAKRYSDHMHSGTWSDGDVRSVTSKPIVGEWDEKLADELRKHVAF